jgi:hypothetical protein
MAQTFRNDSRAVSAFMQCAEELIQSRGRDILCQLLQNSEMHRATWGQTLSETLYRIQYREPQSSWEEIDNELKRHPCHRHLEPYLRVPRSFCGGDELQKDLFIAYSMDYFAHANSKLQKAFFNHRLELLLRILNGAVPYIRMTESAQGPRDQDQRSVVEGMICSFIEAFSTRSCWWLREVPEGE